MKKIIVVMGLPGSGKSTFASALAKRLGAAHINSDQIRHESLRRGQYDPATKRKIYEEMLDLAAEALKTHDTVVIDATFSEAYMRHALIHRFDHLNFSISYLLITANEEDIRERLKHRRTYSEANYEVYQKIKASFEPPDFNYICFNSSELSPEEMVEIYLDKTKSKKYEHSANTTNHAG
ncbi:MAG: hypothetical protein D6730_15115 [Bacteroidetes bacterium]|nr:MAG: hypothetical protein D6730_15115 [Bacteroidota bacterium]